MKISLEELDKIVHDIGILLTVTDTKGMIQYVNRVESGYKKQDFIDSHFSLFLPEEEKGGMDKAFKIALNGKKNSRESYFPFPDGSLKCFSNTISPHYTGSVITHIIIESKDITQQKKTEKAFQNSEQRYKRFVEHASDIIYSCDAKGNFTYVNPVGEKLSEYSLEELRGKHFTTIIKKDYRKKIEQFYIDQYKNLTSNTYLEFPYISKTGKIRWIGQNVQVKLDEDQFVGFQAFARDITERKKIEDKLSQSESQTRALFESIPDLILIINRDTTIQHIKVGQDEQWLNSTEYIGTKLYNLSLSSELKDEFKKNIDHTIISGEMKIMEFSIHLFSKQHTYEARIVKISSDEVLATIRNITERKEFEEKLIHARTKAEDSSLAKEQYLSMMSHEIRTPLNAVIGLTNLLLEETHSKSQAEYLSAIKYSADSLLNIINDLLDFSKIESQNIQLEKTKFSLEHIINGIKKSFVRDINENNITFTTLIDETIPQVLVGDKVRLNQIVLNLISNAIKFTEQGEIKATVKLIKKQGNDIILDFEISDSGIGIPEDQLPLIFESFRQASQPHIKKHIGTGLGLTIAKQLINLMGGDINVKSKIGKGTTFNFNIKLEFDQQTSKIPFKEDPKIIEFIKFKDLSILLVEDNHMNQLVIAKYFEKWGIDLDIAENGVLALEKLEVQNYNLILMDLEMPELDGYKTAEIIRKNKNTSYHHTPIIAITASALVNVKKRVFESGMNGYVSKPFEPQKLYQIISNLTLQNTTVFMHNTQQDTISHSRKLTDLSYLKEASAGDNQFVYKMIDTFIKHAPEYIEKLNKSLQLKDYTELKRLAHKYKATINIVGIRQIEKVIEQLENIIIEKKNYHLIPSLIEEIENGTQEAMDELLIEIEKFQ